MGSFFSYLCHGTGSFFSYPCYGMGSFSSYPCHGTGLGTIGPTMLDLQIRTNSTISDTTLFIVGRAAGPSIGSFLGKPLVSYHRLTFFWLTFFRLVFSTTAGPISSLIDTQLTIGLALILWYNKCLGQPRLVEPSEHFSLVVLDTELKKHPFTCTCFTYGDLHLWRYLSMGIFIYEDLSVNPSCKHSIFLLVWE